MLSTVSIPFAQSGSYPVRAGNRLRPLIDGEPAYSRICEAVEAAQHSVWLTVAWIWDDFRLPGGRGSLFDLLDAELEIHPSRTPRPTGAAQA